jgi:hypothetical protein
MLEVCVVISGALVVFAGLVLWANGGRFKSENDTEQG